MRCVENNHMKLASTISSNGALLGPGRRLARPFRTVAGPTLGRRLPCARLCQAQRQEHQPLLAGDALKRAAWHSMLVGAAALSALVMAPLSVYAAPLDQSRSTTEGVSITPTERGRKDKDLYAHLPIKEQIAAMEREGILHLPRVPEPGQPKPTDTGEICKDEVVWRSIDELIEETEAAIEATADKHNKKLYHRLSDTHGGDKPVKRPWVTLHPAIRDFKKVTGKKVLPVTTWKPEHHNKMTYTRFWNLIREQAVEKAIYTADRRSLKIKLNARAEGGARWDKVSLPFDPDLYEHMLEHGVYVEDPRPNPLAPILFTLIRTLIPVAFCFGLIRLTFRLGHKQEKRDSIFGGINMQIIKPGGGAYNFSDIAGIDSIKAEIREVVEFLKNPARFLEMGARSPAGVLLVGPPGTGKTLLARAVAGEAGVPFFSVSGTEFMEMYAGVGASRIRDMFQQARRAAPCILFIDEFDGVGKARAAHAGNDEAVHTINQLLTELDGFDDNTGVVVFAASNRPQALDNAVTRPGRFDRIITLPLPNVQGRMEILKVHARGRKVSPDLDYRRIARATAGYTGAQLMNLMNNAAIIAARQGRVEIGDEETFEALEKLRKDAAGDSGVDYDVTEISPSVRNGMALYEAARALIGYITPNFDEVQRISVCANGIASASTYFLPMEEHLETRITNRDYMEAKIVVAVAGRCAEQLVLGEANLSTNSGADLVYANGIAREMVYRCGFGRRLGPVTLQDDDANFLKHGTTRPVANISTELALVAFEDVSDILNAAEAKAYWGLVKNYEALRVLMQALVEKEILTRTEITDILERQSLVRFGHREVDGFRWEKDGAAHFPGKRKASGERLKAVGITRTGTMPQMHDFGLKHLVLEGGENGSQPAQQAERPPWWSPANPYFVRSDLAHLLVTQDGYSAPSTGDSTASSPATLPGPNGKVEAKTSSSEE